MYLRLDYMEQEDGICICRCYGYEEVLVLPETIDGKPVTALYDYALSGSRPRIEPVNVKQAVQNEEERGFSGEKELSGEFLKEVYLPGTLKRIGDYAFYFCRNLESLHFRGNLEKLGGGAFVWCRGLKKVTFDGVSRENHGINGVLSELTQELEAEICYRDGEKLRLTFPEYYEESVENTPARIIDIHWHGSGYKYRQCFPGTCLDLKRYDGLFPYAVANEFAETCIRLAMNRLRYPVQLSSAFRERYETYLKEHMDEMLKDGIKRDDMENIRFLAEEGFLDKEHTDRAVELASGLQRAELCSFLMDYRREHFQTGKKTFEL